jgi:hypothetical protein
MMKRKILSVNSIVTSSYDVVKYGRFSQTFGGTIEFTHPPPETVVTIFQTTRSHNIEVSNLHSQCYENLISNSISKSLHRPNVGCLQLKYILKHRIRKCVYGKFIQFHDITYSVLSLSHLPTKLGMDISVWRNKRYKVVPFLS